MSSNPIVDSVAKELEDSGIDITHEEALRIARDAVERAHLEAPAPDPGPPWFRVYIDKKIDPRTGMGGDHSRVFDTTAEDEQDALSKLKLKRGEEVNQVVPLAYDPTS